MLRKERGWTQAKLAELSGQEPSNVSHIERGATKLGLPTLVSLANVLGVTADTLLCDSLKNSQLSYIEEASHILSDCTHDEAKIVVETMHSLKQSLRESRKLC